MTVFAPPLGPSVQQTPAFPLTSVSVEADAPSVPHAWSEMVSGAIVPPPPVTAQATGTPVMTVPFAVRMVTTGRQSGSSAVPTVASMDVQTPLSTWFERVDAGAMDLSAFAAPLLCGCVAPAPGVVALGTRGAVAGFRWKSMAEPPTPPVANRP